MQRRRCRRSTSWDSRVGDLTLLAQYGFYNDRAAQPRWRRRRRQAADRETPASRRRRALRGRVPTRQRCWTGFSAWHSPSAREPGRSTPTSSISSPLGAQDTDLGDRLHYNAAVSDRLRAASRTTGRMHTGLPEPMYHGGPRRQSHTHAHKERPRSGPALDLVLELNGEWHDQQRTAAPRTPTRRQRGLPLPRATALR